MFDVGLKVYGEVALKENSLLDPPWCVNIFVQVVPPSVERSTVKSSPTSFPASFSPSPVRSKEATLKLKSVLP